MPQYHVPPSNYYPNGDTTYLFHTCTARFKWLCGGIGSGKTYAGVIEAARQVFQHNAGKTGLIVVPDFNTFMDVDWPLIQLLWPRVKYKLTKQGAHIHKISINLGHQGISEILIRSAMNQQTVQRIDGPTVSWFWMDEPSRMLCGKQAWQKAIGRLRETGGRPMGFLTGSPRGINWIAEAFQQEDRLPPHAWSTGCEPRRNYWIFAAKTQDNPHNADDYYESLVDAYSEEFALQELEGDIVASEGRIFPNFYRDVHVISHELAMRLMKRSTRYEGGVDFGWTNPGSLLLCGWDGDDNCTVPEEWYHRRKMAEIQGAAACALEFKYTPRGTHSNWWCDHNNETIEKWQKGFILDRVKYRLPGAKKAIKEWQTGVDTVRNLLVVRGLGKLDHPAHNPGNKLGRPGLLVSEKCVHLIKEFLNYREPEIKQDGMAPNEMGVGHDHLLDALRYQAMGYFKRRGLGPTRARGV